MIENLAANIRYRPMTENDGPAFAGLSFSAADAGQIAYTANYLIDAFRAVQVIHGDMSGVVATTPDQQRVLGVGLIRYGTCQYEGAVRPFALLNNLIVHPDYRGRGIAAGIEEWRLQHVRERLGEEAVLLANFQRGNAYPRKTAGAWINAVIGPTRYVLHKTRITPPPPLPGVTVRAAEEDEYAVFAGALNNFYGSTNLFIPESAASLKENLARTPFDSPVRHIRVALDEDGQMLAGMVVLEEYRLKTLEVRNMPAPLRLANSFFQVVPADGVLREVYMDRVWYRIRQEEAARYLIESVRWEWQERANLATVLIDPKGPLKELFPYQMWNSMEGFVGVGGAVAVRGDKSFCPIY